MALPLDTMKGRAQLATAVYRFVYNGTESLEVGTLGADLAYLLGAILTDGFCSWPADRPLVKLLAAASDPQVREALRFVEIEDLRASK